MIKEIIQTGATVEDAIDSGCLLLGVDRSDADFEIIDMPSKKFFGLKSVPAKVRVFIEVADPAPEKTDVGIRVASDPVTEEAPAQEAGEHKEKRRRNRRRIE